MCPTVWKKSLNKTQKNMIAGMLKHFIAYRLHYWLDNNNQRDMLYVIFFIAVLRDHEYCCRLWQGFLARIAINYIFFLLYKLPFALLDCVRSGIRSIIFIRSNWVHFIISQDRIKNVSQD